MKESEKPHILVVDDDARIRDLVTRYLRDHGFIAMTAQDAAAAKHMLSQFDFDAMVLDVMMPGESGLDLTASLPSEQKIPTILLTALGEVDDRIAGFEAGADDYLSKPFEPKELVMRLHAILRRTAKKTQDVRAFKVGRWTFDPDHSELVSSDESRRLTTVEANLLKALAGQAGQPVSREELAKICDVDAGERTIDVQVTRLRRKIEEDTKAPRYLQTVRGKGYLLRVEEL